MMKRVHRATTAAILVALFAASVARGQTTRCEVFPRGGYVGVFADSLAQDSVVVLAPVAGGAAWSGFFHILAVLNGAVADGITGGEFRVHLPLMSVTDVFYLTTPSPSVSIWLGDPFAFGAGVGGVRFGLTACQQGEVVPGGKRIVRLARVQMLSLVGVDTPVLVQMLSPPDPRAPCPNFRLCDANFTPAPMIVQGVDDTGEAFAFRGRLFCDAPVGVTNAGWTAIKALYR